VTRGFSQSEVTELATWFALRGVAGVGGVGATLGPNTFTGTQTIAVAAPDLALDVSGGTSKFSGVVDVWVGGLSLHIGADSGTVNRTDGVTKVGRIGSVNAAASAESTPVAMMFSTNSATANSLFIGGGTGAMTAATAINFYTGATPLTVTGTRRVVIDDVGNVGIGQPAVSKLDVNDTIGGVLTLRRQDASVTANDTIGKLQFWAADTSTVTNFVVADIEAQAASTVTTDINPGRLIFRTTPSTVGAVPVERMRIAATGNIGIGNVTTPTALVHIAAGTSAANTAPLKLTAGTVMTTAENGALEYDGTDLWFTVGTTRKKVTLV